MNRDKAVYAAVVAIMIGLMVVIFIFACVIDSQSSEITKLRKEAMKRGYAGWVDANGRTEFKWKD